MAAAAALLLTRENNASSSAALHLLDRSSAGPPLAPPADGIDTANDSDLLKGLGFASAVLAQIFGSLGLLLMKSSSLYEYGLPWHRKCRLFAGIFFQGFIPIFTDSFAYAVCPLSLLAPLSGVTIAATIILTAARCCGVREPVHCADFAVVLLVIAGVTLVNIYGPHNSSNANMEQLEAYMENTAFIVFASSLGGVVILWMAIYVLVDLECLNWLRPHPVRPPRQPLGSCSCRVPPPLSHPAAVDSEARTEPPVRFADRVSSPVVLQTSIVTCLMCAFSAACCSSLTQIFLKVRPSRRPARPPTHARTPTVPN